MLVEEGAVGFGGKNLAEHWDSLMAHLSILMLVMLIWVVKEPLTCTEDNMHQGDDLLQCLHRKVGMMIRLSDSGSHNIL